jgi:hypothetical protein
MRNRKRKYYGTSEVAQSYPALQSTKRLQDLDTLAVRLTKPQLVGLIKNLESAAAGSTDADIIDVTVYRRRNAATVTVRDQLRPRRAPAPREEGHSPTRYEMEVVLYGLGRDVSDWPDQEVRQFYERAIAHPRIRELLDLRQPRR